MTVIVSLLNKNNNHSPVVEDFNNWNERSFLNVNVPKFQELAIGFMKKLSPNPNFQRSEELSDFVWGQGHKESSRTPSPLSNLVPQNRVSRGRDKNIPLRNRTPLGYPNIFENWSLLAAISGYATSPITSKFWHQ